MSLESVAVLSVIAFFLSLIAFSGVLIHDVYIERCKKQEKLAKFKDDIVNDVCSYFENTK